MIMVFLLFADQMLIKSNSFTLCNLSKDDLISCKPSVTEESPVDPTSQCCSAMSKADLPCLCGYKNSMFLPSLGIDPAMAMQLPVKCKLIPPTTC
ncbi:hypothetical protein GIB67_028833 [Kingdonia uniflora]|uniref:Bifunctional inhibitor/plant lipid transfer protein/seed storage helical domain-containing protein n=1 Tax=Kingdonia uniflora TaxID=39325 RepID=A0A7J7LTF5_9MAGN|nr:hypothetical protein GIB67_028833 [Kingdonia uniflora]